MVTNLDLFASPFQVRLQANLRIPEATAPFYLYPITEIQAVKKNEDHYDGFCIQVKADIRWIKEDAEVESYTMRVWREDGVLCKVPAFEHSLLYNKAEIDGSSRLSNSVINSMDDARHYFEQDKESRMFKYYLIEMPPGITLSSKVVFDDAGDDEELDFAIVPIEVKDGKKFDFTIKEFWLHFTVARTDTKVAKRGKVEKKTKKSKGAAKLDDLMG